MNLTKKYYLKAKIKANYSGYRRDEKSNARQTNYQLRDLLNTEITTLRRTEEYDPKYLVVDDDYLFFQDLYGVLAERNSIFHRINLSNCYITNIHLSEHGKDGIYSFGKLEGIIHATIEKPIEETALPELLSYTDSAEEKQIQFINNTSGTLTEVDPLKVKPSASKKSEVVKKTPLNKKYFSLGEIVAWVVFLMLAIILLVNLWKYIVIILITIAGFLILAAILGSLKQFASFIIGALVLIGILCWLFYSPPLNRQHAQTKDADTKPEITEIKKDTSSSSKNDSIFIVHHRVWNDYVGNNYETDLILNQSAYFNAKRFHFGLSEDGFSNQNKFWASIYGQMSSNDKDDLHFIYDKFDSIGKANNLNQIEFANMIVSCVQDIPYVLIANLDCDKYKQENPQDIAIINQSNCFGPVKFGVQSPDEFMYNLKGDCDTRTLFCYTVLKHFKFDVAILSSEQYRHSILGVGMPVSGSYKSYNGRQYYLWETTAKNCAAGFIAPDFKNLNYWTFTLISN